MFLSPDSLFNMRRPLLLVLSQLNVLLLLLCLAPVPFATGKRVTISNVLPRLDTAGNIINAHDGGLYEFNGVYHLYGTVYQHCHQPAPTCDGQCGYYNNTFSLYTSPDMVQWTLVSLNILPAVLVDHATVPYWMANVAYNPHTRLYMMQYCTAHRHNTAAHCLADMGSTAAALTCADCLVLPLLLPSLMQGTTNTASTTAEWRWRAQTRRTAPSLPSHPSH